MFQANLLATGGSESEIYIYDINSPANPMTPGAKSQVITEKLLKHTLNFKDMHQGQVQDFNRDANFSQVVISLH